LKGFGVVVLVERRQGRRREISKDPNPSLKGSDDGAAQRR